MIDYIKEFCLTKGIKYFYVSSFNENGNVFDFDNTSQSINDFLNFGLLMDQKYLLIEKEIFNSAIEDPEEEFEKYDQQIGCLTLYWLSNGIIHKFEHLESWYDEYLNGANNSEGSIFDEDFSSNPIRLSKVVIDIIINSFVEDENYFKYNTRPSKLESILEDIYLKNNIDGENVHYQDKLEIKYKAQQKFSKYHLVKKEKEFSKVIKDLKNKDGLSKKAIIAQLDITEGIYEKCYNQ
ncbi:hypothetical protein [Cytophaga hutchinsonii]|uniref:Uncharacterized protein n=1 Tax=Cytophaga hutchinsonii (strain ATCC 33406 / DSM 1761 / CIP 103989 / NBRC 15051 / NCIMB 9469 / D465) TaxID=269798 RepID=A0A6N4SWJ1_CYTH3|nr:hypothetical protein [Cytophaga hutchinsonii]ABG60914.1 conserved hypothetical protein [Cytophaga hutchinsonii ATCC 33406]SFX42395.1 hypothetical protein SAMN04487930_10428 [Cytophaga hutchinsonii ATCC 33406]